MTLRLSLGTYPFWYVPVSNAMAPIYLKGDLVFAKATSYDGISVGDVIVHEVSEKNWLWIMRVDSKNDISRTYTTKGDNNPSIIPFQKDLPKVTIISKVVGKIPHIGYLDIFHVGCLGLCLFVFFLVF